MEYNAEKALQCINWRVMLLLSVLLLVCYQNTFNAPWHFDDKPNITANSRVQIDTLHPATVYDAAFGDESSKRLFYRPVAFASFAVNWYFGQDNVTGYHVINLAVHILTAFFLYLSVLALFKTPNLAGRYSGSEHFIALLAAVLWAANPIQTQAVTYIVQRMASMAALFYVLGIYFYVTARISQSTKSRLLLYSGVFIAFLLAAGSKENALMLPAALFLVEMIFFRDLSDPSTRKRLVLAGLTLLSAVFLAGILLFFTDGFLSRLQSGYERRVFTLSERLLTQPRIIVFYISQIFYPIADRLSIDHDIEISTSFFRPWTTLPAILLILGMVAAAFRLITRHPFVSFAVLFFFLNHVIESSIISLEMVFEHRNYLPTLFLFVPVAAGIKFAIDYYLREKRSMAVVITAFATVLVMLLGTGTYVRNMAWSSHRALWQDAMDKAPGRARPHINLGHSYYAKVGEYDRAIHLFERAMHLKHDSRESAKVRALKNMAGATIRRDGNHDEAIGIFYQLLDIAPDDLEGRYNLFVSFFQTGRLDEALEQSDYLLSKRPENVKYLNTRAFIHLRKNQPEKAMPFLIEIMRKSPDDEYAIVSLGFAKMRTGNHIAAHRFLGRIPAWSPHKTAALLLQIENSQRAGNVLNAEKYAKKLLSHTSPQTIREKLIEAQEPGTMWPVSVDIVAPVIAAQLQTQSGMILEASNIDGR